MSARDQVKDMLGELPFTAELYWLLQSRQAKAFSRFNLDNLSAQLAGMVAQAQPHADASPPGKKIFLFASLHFWISHMVATGLTLGGLGHRVTLGYLPYSDFTKPINKFDMRRNNVYAQKVLRQADPLLKCVSFLDLEPARTLPEALTRAVEQITTFDTCYILQREQVTGTEPTYLFRHERNLEAASRAYAYFQQDRPDVVIVPNGMIQEFGAVYETARFLGIPVVTYEFGEQDQRIWLGQNNWVINHLTNEMWASRKDRILSEEQRAWIRSFLAARQKMSAEAQFAHVWQKADRTGGPQTRDGLGLDDRPVVLLPTNVLGDSATLGLTLFSNSMTEWLQRVLLILADRPQVQVVIRIHPAETLTVGPSVAELVHEALPTLPAHFCLIGPQEKVNTYDLMELADLALVYTTTAGMEMAVRGIPVLVSGKAHYRCKGFTLDAENWADYLTLLDKTIQDPRACRLAPAQMDCALNYCYFYFQEYGLPFPWHLQKIWPSLAERPISYVLGPQGRDEYEATFRKMSAELSME